MTCAALGVALALGGLAFGRGLLPPISRVLARMPLLEPTQARSLSLRLLRVSVLLTLSSQTFAVIRDVFTLVGDPLSRVRDALALIRDPVALIRGQIALIRSPLALVGDPRSHPGLWLLTTSLAAQPGTITFQNLIIGLELRRAALNLRADAQAIP